MIADDESLPDKHWIDKSDYVNGEFGSLPRNQNHCNDESVAESSVSPSEADASKSMRISMKPSFKSDASISSSVMKRVGVNKFLSVSQHSKGSYSSARSSHGRKEKRHVLTPFGSRSSAHHFGRVELDASSLGRYSSYEVSSPERISMLAMHSSSPDLYKLNEESQSSNQASPIKQIAINTLFKKSTEINSEVLIQEAQSHDMLSPESLVQKYSLHEENEALKCEEYANLLQEELLEFSKILPLDLPLRNIELPSTTKYIGTLRWQQLIANWKHTEIFQSMVSRYSPVTKHRKRNDEDMQSTGSASSCRHGTNVCGNLELDDVPFRPKNRIVDTAMQSQLHLHFSDVTLSSFLTDIESGNVEAPNQILRHLVSTSGSNESALSILYDEAQKSMTVLNSIVRDTVAFASIKCSNEKERDSIAFSIEVKDRASIDQKAKLKYDGDIFQVKDILRSQITFRSEGELVCGLVRLLRKGKDGSSTDVLTAEKITLIRIKNLFSCNSFSKLHLSPLPTGYRHILLNFRLPTGLIFGKQTGTFCVCFFRFMVAHCSCQNFN